MEQVKIDLGIGLKILSAKERLEQELHHRIKSRQNMAVFGVSYLDDACRGIFSNDFVLIGARTGVGKTQLATIIAKENMKHRRVHYIALEAEPYEIERRILYQEYSELFFEIAKEYKNTEKNFNYIDWYKGQLDDVLDKYYPELVEKLSMGLENLHTHYKPTGCNSDDLVKDIYQIKDNADLIILDHLHYVDFDNENENQGYKKLTKELRSVAIDIGKPVIAIVHVRKADRKQKEITPLSEDIHGSSDIPKIGTNIIMLARCYEEKPSTDYIKNYIRIVKHRKDGSLTSYAGLVDFNWKSQRYAEKYAVGRVNQMNDEFNVLEKEKLPYWAYRNFNK